MSKEKGQVAILLKERDIGAIAFDAGKIGRFDSRSGVGTMPQTLPDGGRAKFIASIASSRANRWNLVYCGERNRG